MMTSTNLDCEDILQQDYDTYLQSCVRQLKKLHKFKKTIESRVYQRGIGFATSYFLFVKHVTLHTVRVHFVLFSHLR
jgi:hypothetical protein